MTELPSATYTWNLDIKKATERTHKRDGKYFKSLIFMMHNFKWHLEFYPNCNDQQYVGLYLYLHVLPSTISKIVIERHIQLLETNTIHSSNPKPFTKDERVRGWGKLRLKSEEIQNMTKFTIKLDMTLFDVFDSNGKNIIKQYIHGTEQKSQAPISINDDQSQKYELRLNSLTTQADQIMKSMTKMENTLKDIQLQMNEEQKK
eukprot:183888_1